MAHSNSDDGVLLQWYRTRIAEPTIDDEVYGYWLFVFGVVVGLFGVLLAGSTAGQTGPPSSGWPVSRSGASGCSSS